MRVIAVGCEYSGVTTLLEGLMKWGGPRGFRYHLDDHFSIPDRQTLSKEDRETMLGLPPALKERYQRFQVVYHLRVLRDYEHVLMGGFHIEEAIYGPLYYYPKLKTEANQQRKCEAEMPPDTLLVLLTANPQVIERRMSETPHDYPIVRKGDIPTVLDRFQQEFGQSLIRGKISIDTSNLDPQGLLDRFLEAAIPHLPASDVLACKGDPTGPNPAVRPG